MRRSLPGTVRTSAGPRGNCAGLDLGARLRRIEVRAEHDHRAVPHQFPHLRINAVDPGYTATDLNAHTGLQTIEYGAEIIVRLATITPDGPTSQYLSLIGVVP